MSTESLDVPQAKDAFATTDKDELTSYLHGLLAQEISALTASDDQLNAASGLYENVDEILKKPDAEEVLKETYKTMKPADLAAFSKFRLVRHLLSTVAAILADRNISDEKNAYMIEKMVELAYQAGYSASDLEKAFSDIDIRKTSTSHPNELLNPDGIRFFRRLIELAELKGEDHAAMARKIIGEMLITPLTPSQRINMFEQTDAAVEQHKTYRKGQRQAFTRVNAAVDKFYGNHAIPPNFSSNRVNIKVVQHAWEFGGDADGNSNSDRWALLYGMLATTRAAIEEHLDDVNRADQEIAKGDDPALAAQWEKASGRLHHVHTALKTLKQRFDALENRFIVIGADGRKALKPGVNYDVVKEEYANIYNGIPIGPVTFKRPLEFYAELEKSFELLAAYTHNANARAVLSESHYMLKSYGLTQAKIETRHNGVVYKRMMDNLFSDRAFLDTVGISTKEFEQKKFTDLSSDNQREMLAKASAKLTPHALREALLRANPQANPDDYSEQTHEFLERFGLMALYPSKFGMAIIADASEMSASYQQFIADSYGLKKILHTSLPEDYESLRHMDGHLSGYHMAAGAANMQQRILGEGGGLSQMHQAQMIPCSDALRILGRLVTYLQAEGIRATTIQSIKMSFATLIKWGNGLSIERGGDDDMAYTRIIAQTIQQHVKERGYPLHPANNEDRLLLRMASFQSNTEQGRAKRFYSSSCAQVSDAICNKIGEFLGRRLELQGKVKEGTFIPQPDKFSKRMHAFLNQSAYKAMISYYDSRIAAVKDAAKSVMNRWAEKVTNMKMMGFGNSSPRAASKTTPNLSDVRAIFTNHIIRSGRSYHDGWFMSGAFMDDIHEAYINTQLGHEDVHDFIIDAQWWRRSFFLRALTASTPSDMEHGFERLGADDQWNYDRAMKIGSSVRIHKNEGETVEFSYDEKDGATPEEAYQAWLFYDQVLFAGLTETALTLDPEENKNKKKLFASSEDSLYDLSFDLSRNEITRKMRPDDNALVVRYGPRIHKRWQSLANIRKQYEAALPEEVLTDLCEADGNGISEADKRLIVGAYLEAHHPDTRQLLGRTSYGRRQEPKWGEAALTPTLQMLPDYNGDAPTLGF